ncbi:MULTISPECIES: LacI family DNA-binding transcriptional regulator [unclassified Pseudomonas]|jgi:LacI family transcriptional regulator|uniref:LacI family DNA-binding transcriptional regulator n=1 Tax=Pseudomonas sp. A-R-26 TaxID=2832404 RepID=UPI001CC12030|nr:substrate-binding domain-containing protein [Pseudomonas sp. A-R-26]
MKKNEKPKLKDVAELAGVSIGSASRALSTPHLVKPATLEKVAAAVLKLGYVRDGAARALASRRTHSIGAIFPTFNNPVFAEAVQALQQRLNELGYHLIISSHEYDQERELINVRNMIERGVEGLLLVGTEHSPVVYDALDASHCPLILMWSLDGSHPHHCVGFSNEEGGRMVAKHLVDLGHKNIAMISGVVAYNERAKYRLKGVADTLKEAGIELAPTQIIQQPFTLEGGRAGLRMAMELTPRPTAIVCSTDVTCMGAIAEARLQGIHVPTELSITGFDDIDFAAVSVPALTTVCVPSTDIGISSANNIIAMIEGRPVARRERVQIDLVVRQSTAPVKS